MRQGQAEDRNDYDQKDQSRHDDAGKLFDSFFNTAEYDPCSECKENQHKYDRCDIGCDEGGKITIRRSFCSVRNKINKKILCDPSADHRIVSHDQGRNQKR